LIWGAIAARWQLGNIPIRRIGICNSWRGKKRRCNLLANELSIEDRLYFHGYAPWSRALDPEGAKRGEAAQCALVAEDPMMLRAYPWERKREVRYHAEGSFGRRFDAVSTEFPRFFSAIDQIRKGGRTAEAVARLREGFSSEILLTASAVQARNVNRVHVLQPAVGLQQPQPALFDLGLQL
jgi:hypothetical protein